MLRHGAISGIVKEQIANALRADLDVMTHATITVAPDDTVKRAMSPMMHHRVRHLPVIANGKLVGIGGIGDIVKHRLEDLETESNVLRDVYKAAH